MTIAEFVKIERHNLKMTQVRFAPEVMFQFCLFCRIVAREFLKKIIQRHYTDIICPFAGDIVSGERSKMNG